MSPDRRPTDDGKPDRPDRAAVDALRARMDEVGRTPKAARSGGRKGGGQGGRLGGQEGGRQGSRLNRSSRRRAAEWDDAAPDATGLDDGVAPEGTDLDGALEGTGLDGGPVDWDEPAAEAPTPLDDRSGRWWDEHPGKPIPVEGGIAASTKRGRIGSTWWSQRFLGAMEAVLVGGRMERGRAYARKGQVVSLELGPGVVAAVVQGSRPEPYRLRLSMPVTTDGEWERIVEVMASQAGFAARLLAGDLPHEVEEVFGEAGASLFPGPGARLVTECTCPDFENPCKHVAAVCYLVAEQFDRDPFRVLEWRGRDRRAVVEALRALRGDPEGGPAGSAPASSAAPTDPGRARAGDDLGAGRPDHNTAHDAPDLEPEGFWSAGPGLGEVHVRPAPAAVPDAVLRQLPRGVLVVKGRDVAEVLAVAYEAFAALASGSASRPDR